ncbi:tryptophan synthase subunit alpha [Dubosiella muris]|uniref:Tryptophan synthase subunit alpha n=1 Tax=Dubosiella muris TaxID=3038133 RepID=A0AC61R854_9FIRM|nr:tryptophan synthase subunit alpha [Dubosiella muris]TGY66138.1 tryptophan synthase subunit alpha [Dubosiella muris]
MRRKVFARKALIAYVMCGDPDLRTTKENILALEQAGADLIELGIPFSDPVAEGEVIAAASERALKNHIVADDVFAMVKQVREKTTIPLVVMTYANVVFAYGVEAFMKRCGETGIEGVILPDVPYEEKAEFETAARAHGVAWIPLVAPTSGARIPSIVKDAEGFVYCVSSLGTTGMRSSFSNELEHVVRQVRAHTDCPCAIGFGISTPKQAEAMADMADSVIVGSAFVDLCARHKEKAPQAVYELAKALKDALRASETRRETS